jgi:hypothetical protein
MTISCHPIFQSSLLEEISHSDSSVKIALHHDIRAIRRTLIVVYNRARLILLQHGAVNVRAGNKKPTNVIARKEAKWALLI